MKIDIFQSINNYFVAQTFLTRLPCPNWVRHEHQNLTQSAAYFPLVGLLIGLMAAILFTVSHSLWPVTLAVAVSITIVIWITGAFHEDGLADCADGIGGGYTLERKLEIMHDSRIGAYGAVAIVASFVLRVLALSAVPVAYIPYALIIAHCLCRWTSLPLIFSSPYVRTQGKAKPFAENLSLKHVIVSSTLVTLLSIFLFKFNGIIIMLVAVLVVLLAYFYLKKQLGGITGDALGATNQITELVIYLLLAALI